VEVEERLRFDEDSLQRYLSAKLLGFEGKLTVKKFGYGASNPTFFITTAAGQKYVLRKKPPGKLIKGAHAIDREYQVMSALSKAGFPAPRMYILCEDESVIGTPFYVMDFIKGQIVDNGVSKLPPHQRRPALLAIVDALAKLHSYDPAAVGLMQPGKEFGKSGGFYERQIKTMSRTSETQVTNSEGKVPPLKSMPSLLASFKANMPEDWSCVIHGDWKPDNVVLSEGDDNIKVLGILDWELSTIGHPMSDLANMCLPYHAGPLGSLVSYGPFDLSEGSGIPSEEEVHKAYCKAAQRPFPIPDWNFFVAFSFFRLAVIVQGVAMRASRGQASQQTSSAQVEGMVQMANALCDKGLETMNAVYRPSSNL
jgi:aminoglycoside phosphotransferase (APT) family kinase protein